MESQQRLSEEPSLSPEAFEELSSNPKLFFKVFFGIELTDYQEAMINDFINQPRVAVRMSRQAGKEQPKSELVFTPNGFISIGSLKVGDVVFGRDGKLCEVLGIDDQGKKDVYELTFNNGQTVRCGLDHLWVCKSRSDRKYKKCWKIYSLREILSKKGSLENDNHFMFPYCDPVNLPKTNHFINPYLFGCLLGDGSFRGKSITFTSEDSELIDFCFLVKSLGGYAKWSKKKTTWVHKGIRQYNHAYLVMIQFEKLNPFRLSRKSNNWRPSYKSSNGLFLVGVKKVGVEDSVCLTVSSVDGTYLTRDFVVTHNSMSVALFCIYWSFFVPDQKIYIIAPTQRQADNLFKIVKGFIDKAPLLDKFLKVNL